MPLVFDIEARDDGDRVVILGRTTFTWQQLDITPPKAGTGYKHRGRGAGGGAAFGGAGGLGEGRGSVGEARDWIPVLVFTGAGSAREQRKGDMGMTERVSTRRGKFQTCPYVRGKYRYYGGEGLAVREPPLRRNGEDIDAQTDGRCGWGKGWVPAFVFTGGRLCAGTTEWGYGNEGRG